MLRHTSSQPLWSDIVNYECTPDQGRAETYGGACTQSVKGAHGTWLLIGLCSLLICATKLMLLDIVPNTMMQV